MKKIMLSQGMKCMVDDSDYEFLNQYKWSVSKSGKYEPRAMRMFSYIKDGKATGRPILMHRIIMLSPPEDFEVDHIDGDGLNNQKSNLRICSHSQNMRNRRQKTQTSSKYKGVHRVTNSLKWGARLQIDKKIVLDKYFDSEIEAAMAYNEAAVKHHREFAFLNRLEG